MMGSALTWKKILKILMRRRALEQQRRIKERQVKIFGRSYVKERGQRTVKVCLDL